MNRIRITLTVVLAVTFPASLSAEGLLYQLPPDGTWVRFNIVGKATKANGRVVTETGTITISSVGTAEVDRKCCRWIEIAMNRKSSDFKDPLISIDKVLIPEEHLAKGKDPLQHILKAWNKRSYNNFGLRQIENLQGRDAEELNQRLCLYFPGPFKAVEKLDKSMIDCKLGKVECDGITASEIIEHNGGVVIMDTTYTIRLNKKAPFGVAGYQYQGNLKHNGLFAGTSAAKLTLIDFGKDAKSAIPNAK